MLAKAVLWRAGDHDWDLSRGSLYSEVREMVLPSRGVKNSSPESLQHEFLTWKKANEEEWDRMKMASAEDPHYFREFVSHPFY